MGLADNEEVAADAVGRRPRRRWVQGNGQPHFRQEKQHGLQISESNRQHEKWAHDRSQINDCHHTDEQKPPPQQTAISQRRYRAANRMRG